MPVLPEVGSTIVSPDLIRPGRSACVIIARQIRSLTLPRGGSELAGVSSLPIGCRTKVGPGLWLNTSEVMSVEHRHFHSGKHLRMIAARRQSSRARGSSPLGIVFFKILRRLAGRRN